MLVRVLFLATVFLIDTAHAFVAVVPATPDRYLTRLKGSNDGEVSTTAASTKSSDETVPKELTEHQLDFVMGYLNKHHSDLLTSFAAAFSPLGTQMAKANAFSGGSFAIENARITDITSSAAAADGSDEQMITLDVTVKQRKGSEQRTVEFPISADPVPERARRYSTAPPVPEVDPQGCVRARLPIDDVVRKLCRLCWIVNQPAVSGKLIQLAIQLDGAGVGELPENL